MIIRGARDIRGSGGGGGGGKGGGGATRVAVEAPDSLQSRQFVRLLDLLCEGEVEGLVDGLKSVYLNETPLQAADGSMNFAGVKLATRDGTQAQTYIPGFESQETETSVGVEVTNATPVVRTISNLDADAVRVTLSVPALTYQNISNGDLSGYSVQIAIDIQPDGGSYVEQNLGGLKVISGKTRSGYQRAYRIPLVGTGPWNVRVRRISADSVAANIQDKSFWSSFTTIIDKKFSYPNSALVGLEVDATYFTSVPQRAYHMKLMRVRIPTNYDPVTRSYSGTWDGSFQIAWTDNPAWCFYDLLTSTRYGLGNYIPEALIDKWSLYQIAQYCDELVPDGKGGTEPRFTCNILLQSREEAFEVIQNMASVFRGMVYWASGAVYTVQDAPADPVILFNQANVEGGVFNREGSGRKARHTVAIVEWNDPNDFFRLKPEYVEDSDGVVRYGVREIKLVAFACSSQGQAARVGRWILFTEKYESEIISFKTGIDASFLRPGQLAKIVDPSRSNQRWGGRVVYAQSNLLQLDSDIVIESGMTYTISVIMPSGQIIDRMIETAPSTTDTVHFSEALPSFDIAGAVWVIASDDIEPEIIRILAMNQDGPGFKVIGALHYPGKYDLVENGYVLQVPRTSNLKVRPDPVKNLAGSEYLYKASGSVLTKLVISFDPSPGAAFYDISYRRADGNIIVIPRTTSTHVEVNDAVPGNYELNVLAISAAGVVSLPATASYTVLGKAGINPSDVDHIVVTAHKNGVRVEWPEIGDLDRMDYEVRIGADFDSGVSQGIVAGSFMELQPMAAGSYNFHVKARDTSYNYSDNPASYTLVIAAPSTVTFKDTARIVGADFRIEWNVPATTFSIAGYNVKYGATYGAATLLETIQSTAYQAPVNWGGARTFWVEAIDSAGNVGAVGNVEISVLAPNQTAIVAQVIDNNVLLYWQDVARTLPVMSYEVRKGNVYASATVIGTKSGLFTTVMETEAGEFKYWITGIDTAGNYGTPASMVTQVNEPPDYILRADYDSALDGTLNNAYFDNGSVVLPVNTTETVDDHFTDNSFTNPDNQINAGFPIYIQPTLASGYYQEEIDYGAVLAGSKITVSADLELFNSPTVEYKIAYKLAAGDPWTEVTASQVYATNFRYIRITITVTSTGSDDIARINSINIRLDSKLKTITGIITANAGDATGTRVYLTDDGLSTGNPIFVDVDAIQLTALGTGNSNVVYNFTDAPYPTYFDVYRFVGNTGVRETGQVSYMVRGF